MVQLTNKSLTPIISFIQFRFNQQNRCSWIKISIESETVGQKEAFKSIPGMHLVNPLGFEEMTHSFSNNLPKLIALLQTIEPLPRALFEALNEYNISFPEYLLDPVEIATQGDIKEAIAVALKAGEEGCPDKIIDLANYYQETEQLESWVNVLESVPQNHVHVVESNKNLLEYFNLLEMPSAGSDKLDLLSKKFKAAYHGQLTIESECYFAELAGEKGVKSLLPLKSGSDADLLISLALILRTRNEKINTLESASKINSSENNPSRFFGI